MPHLTTPRPSAAQVGIRSINREGKDQAARFGVEQIEMRHFSKHRERLESLVRGSTLVLE